jgi:hypothetical protein
MTLACTSSAVQVRASGRGRLSRRLHRPARRCRAPPPAATDATQCCGRAGAQAGAARCRCSEATPRPSVHAAACVVALPAVCLRFLYVPPSPRFPYRTYHHLGLLCSARCSLCNYRPACAACVLLLFLCMHPACVCRARQCWCGGDLASVLPVCFHEVLPSHSLLLLPAAGPEACGDEPVHHHRVCMHMRALAPTRVNAPAGRTTLSLANGRCRRRGVLLVSYLHIILPSHAWMDVTGHVRTIVSPLPSCRQLRSSVRASGMTAGLSLSLSLSL